MDIFGKKQFEKNKREKEEYIKNSKGLENLAKISWYFGIPLKDLRNELQFLLNMTEEEIDRLPKHE